MLAAGVCVAPTDEEAQVLRSSQILAFANLRTGNPGPLPRPVERVEDHVPPAFCSKCSMLCRALRRVRPKLCRLA